MMQGVCPRRTQPLWSLIRTRCGEAMLPHQVCSCSAPVSELNGWNVGFSVRHLIQGYVPVVSSSFLAVTSSVGWLVLRWSRPAHTLLWSVLLCPSLSSGFHLGPRLQDRALSRSLQLLILRWSLQVFPLGQSLGVPLSQAQCLLWLLLNVLEGSAQMLWVESVFSSFCGEKSLPPSSEH